MPGTAAMIAATKVFEFGSGRRGNRRYWDRHSPGPLFGSERSCARPERRRLRTAVGNKPVNPDRFSPRGVVEAAIARSPQNSCRHHEFRRHSRCVRRSGLKVGILLPPPRTQFFLSLRLLAFCFGTSRGYSGPFHRGRSGAFAQRLILGPWKAIEVPKSHLPICGGTAVSRPNGRFPPGRARRGKERPLQICDFATKGRLRSPNPRGAVGTRYSPRDAPKYQRTPKRPFT
jgi:hypothetical protein